MVASKISLVNSKTVNFTLLTLNLDKMKQIVVKDELCKQPQLPGKSENKAEKQLGKLKQPQI